MLVGFLIFALFCSILIGWTYGITTRYKCNKYKDLFIRSMRTYCYHFPIDNEDEPEILRGAYIKLVYGATGYKPSEPIGDVL